MSSDLSEQWLEKAAEDLEVARLVLSEGHVAHNTPMEFLVPKLAAYLPGSRPKKP